MLKTGKTKLHYLELSIWVAKLGRKEELTIKFRTIVTFRRWGTECAQGGNTLGASGVMPVF